MIGIYKIISPVGKIYIGQSLDIYKRWEYYKRLACKKQPKVYNSLVKYGSKNHMFEILEECDEILLDEREIYWGNHYSVLKENGLNLALGNRYGKYSEEVKQKMRKPKPKGFGEAHSLKMLGKKQSTEQIQKIAVAKYKPIFQYNLQGIFIQEWASGKKASISLKIDNGGINMVLKGKRKTTGGFIFKYKENK